MSPPPPLRHTGAALLAAALLVACAASPWWQEDLQAWIGAPTAEVLEAWGPPLRTLSDADGKTVLVFERTRSLDRGIERLAEPGAPLEPGRPREAYSPQQQDDCTLFFEISGSSVAAVRHEGTACDVVPRDPARRRADPSPSRTR
jgi:hypothetical protein